MVWNRTIATSVFSLLVACQAPQKAAQDDMSAQNPGVDATHEDKSEGVVGPDEAFFAAYYLEQVFHYSQENASPNLDSLAGVVPEPASAFDFQANFSDERLRLMSQTLLALADLDRDGNISESEFAGLKLDLNLLGSAGETLSHAYDQNLFFRMAGADEFVQEDEVRDFLRDIGPMIKIALDRLSLQDQRRHLIRAWEKILGRYDADQNGSLSLQEQRDLRKDRALLVSRLIGE